MYNFWTKGRPTCMPFLCNSNCSFQVLQQSCYNVCHIIIHDPVIVWRDLSIKEAICRNKSEHRCNAIISMYLYVSSVDSTCTMVLHFLNKLKSNVLLEYKGLSGHVLCVCFVCFLMFLITFLLFQLILLLLCSCLWLLQTHWSFDCVLNIILVYLHVCFLCIFVAVWCDIEIKFDMIW